MYPYQLTGAASHIYPLGTVGNPLRGWVGFTNTGESVRGMIITVFSSDGSKRLVTTKTNDSGTFTISGLKPGEYYVTAQKEERNPDGELLRVSADSVMVHLNGNKSATFACFVAEADAGRE